MLSSLISMLIIFVLAMSKLALDKGELEFPPCTCENKSKAMNSKSLIAWFVHTHHKCVIEKALEFVKPSQLCRRGRGGFKQSFIKKSSDC